MSATVGDGCCSPTKECERFRWALPAAGLTGVSKEEAGQAEGLRDCIRGEDAAMHK